MAGRLAIVATPIGNLQDITPRAVATLREATVILAEDTRRARALLSHLGIAGKRVERLDSHVERGAAERWGEVLATGATIALVSDAGTPVISDPGAFVVRAAAARGIAVTPIPGPSAVIAALSAAGMAGNRFRFLGFLPKKGTARRRAIADIVEAQEMAVFFESPERAAATLRELAAEQPAREAMVARELTKLHEELARGTLAELARREAWRGELTIVVGPRDAAPAHVPEIDLDARIDALLGQGLRVKEVAKALATQAQLPARDLYARVLSRAKR